MALWFFPMAATLKPITKTETEWAYQLPAKRSKQYQHSRGYVREALSQIWNVPALKIPLHAPPGDVPVLDEGWGNVSFSHCCDGLFIGWSLYRIGVDIERADRNFKADLITKRYFSAKDNESLKNLHGNSFRAAVLKQWLIKEAAIKWQRGRLSADIAEWNFCKLSHEATHQSKGYKLGVHFIKHRLWNMAVAFEKRYQKIPPIICTEYSQT
ncbi:4'-phosphopantetheinyl transferase superfamily protein [Prochlorococcus sp. MIT 1307]|uniref:4'-phosphopantetheinyl transferase family protein n=1 Tax=Prochlorococcus sp. MIT 1307 TaxID=3096219 RepID=UPI002A74E743|nr:4'-phosphopantetheinyl transferase superfamily protein [Prochlorococcus sp. MIT 1307]